MAKSSKGSRSGRGRHRSRGNASSRSRSLTRGEGMPEYADFIAPIFAAGLANYGAQDSPFVTPFVGVTIGGLGLAHVPTNVAILVPSAVHAPSKSPVTDVNAVKDLVRKQVYVCIPLFCASLHCLIVRHFSRPSVNITLARTTSREISSCVVKWIPAVTCQSPLLRRSTVSKR